MEEICGDANKTRLLRTNNTGKHFYPDWPGQLKVMLRSCGYIEHKRKFNPSDVIAQSIERQTCNPGSGVPDWPGPS